MPKLSLEDQIKALRTEIEDLKSDTIYIKYHSKDVETRIKAIQTEISDLSNNAEKRFSDLDQTLFKWKSELFNKIDEGYTTRWKDQTLEHAAIQSRLEEHQENIEQIKTHLALS
jgi:predicted  nucleic acid-binding Zn-ribbon protein